MKKRNKISLFAAAALLLLFVLWTVSVSFIDVKPIGPMGSTVGFAALNAHIHNLTGVNMLLYTLTDWLGLVPFAFALGFAFLGLIQWIKRKSIFKVDKSILLLGAFYVAVAAVYALFEVLVINYRPVLINGVLEASYPSSTTMLALCVMPTAMMQLAHRIKSRVFRLCVETAIAAFIAFMVIGRFFSGVHWFTDIVGGALLSGFLVLIYSFACGICEDS